MALNPSQWRNPRNGNFHAWTHTIIWGRNTGSRFASQNKLNKYINHVFWLFPLPRLPLSRPCLQGFPYILTGAEKEPCFITAISSLRRWSEESASRQHAVCYLPVQYNNFTWPRARWGDLSQPKWQPGECEQTGGKDPGTNGAYGKYPWPSLKQIMTVMKAHYSQISFFLWLGANCPHCTPCTIKRRDFRL